MILTIVAFIFVLGVLVLVHEWGHFIVAKKMGVRVDEFSIGFPPKMLTLFKRNGTEYILSWLPFGGYVKMAGMDFDESATTQLNASGYAEEDDYEPPAEHELFSSKTTGQRFWIIFAGPATNYIFAFLLFIGIYFVSGVPIPTGTTIEVEPNSIAAQAGLKTGDRIIAINNEPMQTWRDVSDVLTREKDQSVQLTAVRPTHAFQFSDVPFGLADSLGLEPSDEFTTVITVQPNSIADSLGFQTGDEISAIAGQPVEFWWDVAAILSDLSDTTYTLTIATDTDSQIEMHVTNLREMASQYQIFSRDGFKTVLIMQPDTLQTDSLATGLDAQLIAVNGQPVANWWDVTRLVTPPVQTVSVTVERDEETTVQIPELNLAAGLDSLGLSVYVTTRVGDVQKDSAAELGGLQAGDQIVAIGLNKVKSWQEMANIINANPDTSLMFTVRRDDSLIQTMISPRLKPAPAANNKVKKVGQIGIRIDMEREQVTFLESVKLGAAQTWGFSLLLMDIIKMMLQGDVSRDMVGGPVAIGQFAGETVRWGFLSLLQFMAVLSIQLAVLNLIIPIPILDGGQIFFIALEKLRGRPISPENRMRFAQIGIFLLLTLMIFVTILDITR